MYKSKVAQRARGNGPRLNENETLKQISQESGIGLVSVKAILSEYREKKTFSSPNKKTRPKVSDKVDEIQKDGIRQIIQQLLDNDESPTLTNILKAMNADDSLPKLSRTSLHRLLKHMQVMDIRKSGNYSFNGSNRSLNNTFRDTSSDSDSE